MSVLHTFCLHTCHNMCQCGDVDMLYIHAHMYVHTYTCMYVHICTHLPTYMHTLHTHMHTCMYVRTCTHLHTHMYTYMHTQHVYYPSVRHTDGPQYKQNSCLWLFHLLCGITAEAITTSRSKGRGDHPQAAQHCSSAAVWFGMILPVFSSAGLLPYLYLSV